MEITLIRHTSVDVPKGVCYGQTDVPLTDSFKEEATLVAASLEGECFDKVFTSPLIRCTKLATYCGYGDAVRDDRLKEINFGQWEMQCFDEIGDTRLEQWCDDSFNTPAPEGESFKMLLKRLLGFFDDLVKYDYQHVGIFTHGGILTCAQLLSGDMKVADALASIPPYGGIVKIRI
ncbi:MAG: alpha-ribazole phosphatase [Tannerellaceae bacterium]|nr:alpha-ribazole phosphatase [Tannerellaceae bacterium]